MPESDAPVAEPSAAPTNESTASATEPAAPSDRPSLGTLADAFRNDPDGAALKGRGPRSRAEGSPDDDASPEESARSDATASALASKPGDRPGPSRRGAAAAIHEKDQEIERLVAERTAEKARAEAAASRLTQLEQQQEQARRAALEKIGDDAEFEQLQQARLHNRALTYEQDERLDQMLAWRQHASTLWELADKAHRVQTANALAGKTDRYGIGREEAFGEDLPGLLQRVYDAGTARSAERIKELETELKGLRTQHAAGGRAAPTVGGASAGTGALGRMPDDGASAEEWFRYGIAARQSARPGTGAAQNRR